jgi:hypothetical protein
MFQREGGKLISIVVYGAGLHSFQPHARRSNEAAHNLEGRKTPSNLPIKRAPPVPYITYHCESHAFTRGGGAFCVFCKESVVMASGTIR